MDGPGKRRGAQQSYMHETGLGHCCFAGCTLTNCPRCGDSYCVRSMHVCAYRGRHRAED